MLLTHNIGLKYVFDQTTLNARQARWLAFLSEGDFEIKHIKGKQNIVADALSQKQYELHIVLISSYESKLINMLKSTSNEDPEYKTWR